MRGTRCDPLTFAPSVKSLPGALPREEGPVFSFTYPTLIRDLAFSTQRRDYFGKKFPILERSTFTRFPLVFPSLNLARISVVPSPKMFPLQPCLDSLLLFSV